MSLEEAEEFTIDLSGCARCDSDGHPGLTFRRLVIPVYERDSETVEFSHWAPCPTNGDPILLSWLPKPKEEVSE